MATSTLTSLAILRVQINLNGDYLTYLEPFILQILADCRVNVVTTRCITEYLVQKFGLAIPERAVEVVLRRFAKRNILNRENNEFKITGRIPDPELLSKQAEAERHIRSVINGVRRFSLESVSPVEDEDQVVEAICSFLSEFDVSCLRSYLRGTAIPETSEAKPTLKAMVSNYVQSIHLNEPERFKSFLVLVQGHMLANALICTDLQHAPKSFSNVIFYLDTPLLVRRLGLEGKAKQNAASELIELLKNLEGKVAAFSHSIEELRNVIQGASVFLESRDGRGPIIEEARQTGTTRADLILMAERIDDHLAEASIGIEPTPEYTQQIQIDEAAFQQVLVDEISYFNPRAKEFDVNSVRSIYVKRNKKHVPSLEKCHAVLVTSNSAFAKAAWQYGQQYAPSQAASTVITDFTLANIAWLKAPMGGPEVPTTQLMAFCYAALRPSRELLGRYLNEIEKLEELGVISERDHQLLRSSPMVPNELMNLTLGDDELLSEGTVTQLLERVTNEIKKEEADKTEQSERERLIVQQALNEQTERQALLESESLTTQEALQEQIQQNNRIRSNLYWDCQKTAKFWARGISIGFAVLLTVVIALSSIGFVGLPTWLRWPVVGVLGVLTTGNLLYGMTVKGAYNWIERKLRIRFMKHRANTLGVHLEELDVT